MAVVVGIVWDDSHHHKPAVVVVFLHEIVTERERATRGETYLIDAIPNTPRCTKTVRWRRR